MRQLIVCLLMMLVMWQNVSFAAMPCHASPHETMAMQTSESSMHADHDMNTMSHQTMQDQTMQAINVDDSSEDCCKEQCYCPTTACNNVHFVQSSLSAIALTGILLKVNPLNERLDEAPIYSLYKPPILA